MENHQKDRNEEASPFQGQETSSPQWSPLKEMHVQPAKDFLSQNVASGQVSAELRQKPNHILNFFFFPFQQCTEQKNRGFVLPAQGA